MDLGGFREIIALGAFARTLRDGHPVFAVHHHSMADLLGSNRSGTLKLSEDSRELHFELAMPDSSLGRDIHELVKRGDLASMSFSFIVNGAPGEQWRETSNGEIERTLIDISLLEISTLALPAYPSSSVSARHAIPWNQTTRNGMLRRYMATRIQAA